MRISKYIIDFDGYEKRKEVFRKMSGINVAIADDNERILDLLGEMPPKHKIVGCMMVGYPKYKFRRMPERQHLKVEFK